jgi:hypothetical protein
MTRGERHNPFSGFAPLPGPSTFIHTLLFILGYRYHRTTTFAVFSKSPPWLFARFLPREQTH